MVTTRPMGAAAEVFHWTMILLTGGLWVPVYIGGEAGPEDDHDLAVTGR